MKTLIKPSDYYFIMGWLAFDNIEEALQDSKDILLPFDLKVWSLFAVIILLTGYFAMSFPGLPTFGGDFEGPGTDFDMGNNVPETLISGPQDLSVIENFVGNFESSSLGFTSIWLLAILIPALLLLMTLISFIFEFVMYNSVKEKEPHLNYARNYLFEGLQYFIFRLAALFALVTVVVLGLMIIFVNYWLALIVVPAFLMFYVFYAGVRWTVFHFTLPEMIYNEVNIIEGFKSSIGVIQTDFAEVAVFWFVKWLISLVLSIGASLVVVSGLIMLAIPFVLIGALLAIITPWLAVPVVIGFIVISLTFILYLGVPIRVYLYSYILNVYEDIFQ